MAVGAIGATGTTAANALAREADVVIGVGTRYSDFTTASARAVRPTASASSTSTSPAFDAFKHAGLPLVADAREGLEALTERAARAGRAAAGYRARAAELSRAGTPSWTRRTHLGHGARCPPSPR